MGEEKLWEESLGKNHEAETKEKIEETLESLGLKAAFFEKLCMTESRVAVYPVEDFEIIKDNGEIKNDKEMMEKMNDLASKFCNEIQLPGCKICAKEMKKIEDTDGYMLAEVKIDHNLAIRFFSFKRLAESKSMMPYIEVSDIIK